MVKIIYIQRFRLSNKNLMIYYIFFSFSFITHSLKSYWFYEKGVERNCNIYTFGKCKFSKQGALLLLINYRKRYCMYEYSSSNPWYGCPVEKSMQPRQLYASERYIRTIRLSSYNRVYSNFIFTAKSQKCPQKNHYFYKFATRR